MMVEYVNWRTGYFMLDGVMIPFEVSDVVFDFGRDEPARVQTSFLSAIERLARPRHATSTPLRYGPSLTRVAGLPWAERRKPKPPRR